MKRLYSPAFPSWWTEEQLRASDCTRGQQMARILGKFVAASEQVFYTSLLVSIPHVFSSIIDSRLTEASNYISAFIIYTMGSS